ncbi:hypothetical protein GCM10009557_33660 [Virgisporangium ochraceum]|uniref:Uncharacterized protein n=1 Tax=Virgisporangium ochraceum TaxID=65505 RepID=A0A8J4A721_9ACTN|nr:hypothetical protein [Virgisporangium ochraceum]GIJ74031.1 hypothetical protein Voc01_089480 [Virgisporangium ochraceum]
MLLRLQSYLHALIRERAARQVDESALRLPELEAPLELDPPAIWFPVPGMYGGFSLRLDGDGHVAKPNSDS